MGHKDGPKHHEFINVSKFLNFYLFPTRLSVTDFSLSFFMLARLSILLIKMRYINEYLSLHYDIFINFFIGAEFKNRCHFTFILTLNKNYLEIKLNKLWLPINELENFLDFYGYV